MEELQRQTDALADVSLESVHAAARRYAAPESAFLLLVGNRTSIEEAVRELGLGEMVILDAEGRRTTALSSD